jgi:tetratricopeptide (TPR) repeat protein
MEKKDYLTAIVHFRQALAISPGDSASMAFINLCEEKLSASRDRVTLINQMLKNSIDQYAEHNYVEALLGFEEILNIDPAHALAIEYKQKTLVNMDNIKQQKILQARKMADKKDYDGAINALEEALYYSRDDSIIVGEISSLKKKKQAASAARAIPDSKPEQSSRIVTTKKPAVDKSILDDMYRKGMRHFEAGNFEEATQAFLELWTLDPQYHNVSKLLTKAYLLMGMRLYSNERYEEAVNIWEKSLKIDPNNIKAKRYLIKTREEMDKLGGVSNG